MSDSARLALNLAIQGMKDSVLGVTRVSHCHIYLNGKVYVKPHNVI